MVRTEMKECHRLNGCCGREEETKVLVEERRGWFERVLKRLAKSSVLASEETPLIFLTVTACRPTGQFCTVNRGCGGMALAARSDPGTANRVRLDDPSIWLVRQAGASTILHGGELGCVKRFRRQGFLIAKGSTDPLPLRLKLPRPVGEIHERPPFILRL